MTALGKLLRTTAFKLSLAYLAIFAFFAIFVLGYVAFSARGILDEAQAAIAAVGTATGGGIGGGAGSSAGISGGRSLTRSFWRSDRLRGRG
mgnify:CR=1 FL=1